MDVTALRVKGPVGSWLFWTPRVMTILFAAFVSLFAFDVFDARLDLWRTMLALFAHLIPSFVVLLFLAIAWRWEWVGSLAYSTLSVLYVMAAWGRLHWSASAVISGPLLIIGLLFLFGWLYRDEPRVAS